MAVDYYRCLASISAGKAASGVLHCRVATELAASLHPNGSFNSPVDIAGKMWYFTTNFHFPRLCRLFHRKGCQQYVHPPLVLFNVDLIKIGSVAVVLERCYPGEVVKAIQKAQSNSCDLVIFQIQCLNLPFSIAVPLHKLTMLVRKGLIRSVTSRFLSFEVA